MLLTLSDAHGVARHTLSNGVRVLVEPIPTARSVAAGVWVHAGSRDEAPHEAGVTHFIEHMVFKGTARRKTHHIARRMESVGGYLNAFTTKDHTCYYARGLDEHLGRAVNVVSDLITSPSFPESEIPKEQEVVLEEMRMYADQPEEAVYDLAEDVLYPDHALGRPIIGTEDSVRGLDRDLIQRYVDRQYVASRVVLTVAGNVRPDQVFRLAERELGGLRGGGAPHREAPPEMAPSETVVQRPIQQAHLVITRRAFAIGDERRTAMGVLNTLLGGGMSSLLSQNIREKYGFCYSIYSYYNLFEDSGDFGVYMATEPGRVERSKALILREMRRLADQRVSPRALGQAKAQVKGGMLLGLESLTNRMNRLGRQELTMGELTSPDAFSARVDAVTADEVRALAEWLADPDAFSSVALAPSE
jgi:predicted Zn-dependent peptidase